MELKAHSYDITLKDDAVDRNGETHLEIQLWCFDKDSQPCLVRIRDFPVLCKMELPVSTDKYGNMINWEEDNSADLLTEIKNYMNNKDIEPFSHSSYQKFTRLYYYSGGRKFPYIVLAFNTIKDMRQASRRLKTFYSRSFGKLSLIFREMEISPYNKMFSLKNLGPTERFLVKVNEVLPDEEERITKPGPSWRPFREYEADWRTMTKLPEDMWFTYPIIFSWDIECYSHNPKKFPSKHNSKDRIFSISITTQVHMKENTRKDIIIIIGPSDPIDNVVTYNVEDEDELIRKFFYIVKDEDPDVFIGYNIFGFDYDYLDARILTSGQEWDNIGRLLEQKCEIKDIKWHSGAYGHNNINYIDAAGRISVDMYPYIKRDYKLPLYNLNTVGHYFLGENKTDLKYDEIFEIHKEMTESMKVLRETTGKDNCIEAMNVLKDYNLKEHEEYNLKKAIEGNTLIVKYNVQDSVLVLKLFEKLNVWISLIELSSIVRVTPMEFFTRGQQVRCIAQLYHASSHRNIVLTRRDTDFIFFNGGYVADPRAGFWELVICFDFNSLYPSIMIAYNICFTTLMRNIDDVKKDDYHHFSIDQEEPLEVKPPSNDNFDYGDYFDDDEGEIKGDKSQKVDKHYDFGFVKKDVQKGLLPEILENLLSNRKDAKKEMKKATKMMEVFDDNLLVPYRENTDIKIEDLNDKGRELMKSYFNVEIGNVKEYLERINQEFFSYKVKETMYNSRQLGLKVSANSIYGFLGAQVTGKFSLIEGSMCVTSRGRELIIQASKFFEDKYDAITVYGDTDSTMVYVPSLGNDPSKVWEMAEKMEDHINGKDGQGEGIFPPPLYLEFEKAMRSLFMKKKKYAYMTYDRKGNIIKEKGSDKYELNVKGIILARRDNCQWLRDTYEKCIRSIFDEKSIYEVYDIINKAIVDCVELKYHDDNQENMKEITNQLSIIRAMGSNYKSKSYFLSIFSDLMKSIGKPIAPSERFKFVVVNDHQGRDKIGYRMRTDVMFTEQWDKENMIYGEKLPEDYELKTDQYPPEEIDSSYYIMNVLKEPIDQLFEFGFARVLEKYKEVRYQPCNKKRRCKPVGISTPVKMVEMLILDRDKSPKEIVDTLKMLPDWFRSIEV
jgi:DNA polymerase delta subunit 1